MLKYQVVGEQFLCSGFALFYINVVLVHFK